MKNQIFAVLRRISGQANVLVIPRIFIDLCDHDKEAAMMLSQMIYWSDRATMPDGWFAKSYPEWMEELDISEYKAPRISSYLRKRGFVKTKIKKFGGVPTTHYQVQPNAITDALIALEVDLETAKNQNGNRDYRGMETATIAVSLTETTAEINQSKELIDSGTNETEETVEETEQSEQERTIKEVLDKFMSNWGKTKAINKVQYEVIKGISLKYPTESIDQFLKWAGGLGMSFGQAVNCADKTLEKWGKAKPKVNYGSGRRNGNSLNDRLPDYKPPVYNITEDDIPF